MKPNMAAIAEYQKKVFSNIYRHTLFEIFIYLMAITSWLQDYWQIVPVAIKNNNFTETGIPYSNQALSEYYYWVSAVVNKGCVWNPGWWDSRVLSGWNGRRNQWDPTFNPTEHWQDPQWHSTSPGISWDPSLEKHDLRWNWRDSVSLLYLKSAFLFVSLLL